MCEEQIHHLKCFYWQPLLDFNELSLSACPSVSSSPIFFKQLPVARSPHQSRLGRMALQLLSVWVCVLILLCVSPWLIGWWLVGYLPQREEPAAHSGLIMDLIAADCNSTFTQTTAPNTYIVWPQHHKVIVDKNSQKIARPIVI